MTLKLGGEYELKDVEVKTSTIEARELFLELIWEMKPDAVIDLIRLFNLDSIPSEWNDNPECVDLCAKLFLFHTQYHQFYSTDITTLGFKEDVRNTPFLAYFDFILKNQSELNDLVKKSKENLKQFTHKPKKHLIINSALDQLIPSWNNLKQRKDSKWLCKTLIEWSEKWNLTEDWCLDFALECLKSCKINLIDRFQIPENYLSTRSFGLLREYNNFWQSGAAWNFALGKQIWANQDNYAIAYKMPDYPEFNFIWRNEDSVQIFKVTGTYYPLNTLEENFRSRVEEEFWGKFFDYYKYKQHLLVGNSKFTFSTFERFQWELERYIKKVEKKIKPFVNKTVSKKGGDKHFRWLIALEIPPLAATSNLSKINGVTEKAVDDAVKRVASLIGFTRKTVKKRGRPKGSKDSYKRHRASVF